MRFRIAAQTFFAHRATAAPWGERDDRRQRSLTDAPTTFTSPTTAGDDMPRMTDTDTTLPRHVLRKSLWRRKLASRRLRASPLLD